jgi:hypothetical protein
LDPQAVTWTLPARRMITYAWSKWIALHNACASTGNMVKVSLPCHSHSLDSNTNPCPIKALQRVNRARRDRRLQGKVLSAWCEASTGWYSRKQAPASCLGPVTLALA